MRTTKVLEGAVARALFVSENLECRLSPKDSLMLQIFSTEGSLGHHLLTEWLRDGLVDEMREHFIAPNGGIRLSNGQLERSFRGYIAQLSARFGEEVRLTTIHAMIDILSDKRTISARILPRYGITIALLTTWLMRSAETKVEI